MGVLKHSLLLSVLLACACLGTTPEQQLRADQGNYDDGDEEHRPGQPCLACHSSEFSPGGDVFAVAGTIFGDPSDDDEDGLEGVSVIMTDSDGREFTAITNGAGNFMVQVGSGGGDSRRGRLSIGFSPTFPLSVEIERDGDRQEMTSRIGRDGSCASCHRGESPSAEQVEKVWLFDQP